MKSGFLIGLLILNGSASLVADTLKPVLESVTRPWIGADFWANPMEDWTLDQGIPKNLFSGGDRELVLLTAELMEKKGGFEIEATFTPAGKPEGAGFLGFQIGLKGEFDDYRDSAIYGSGFAAGVTAEGHLFIAGTKSEKPLVELGASALPLKLAAVPGDGGFYQLTLSSGGAELVHPKVDASWLRGLVSFTVSSQPPNQAVVRSPRPAQVPAIQQARGGSWKCAVTGMSLAGEKVAARSERSFGPILWTQHSLEHSGKLHLTALFAPVVPGGKAVLELDGKAAAEAAIDPRSRVAAFHLEGIDTRKDHRYVVRYQNDDFAGTIRREPLDKKDLTVASLSCNDSTGFPHNLLVRNVGSHKPDLIAFLGDQIYEPIGGYGLLVGANNSDYDDRTTLCYLRKYAMHGWTWRDILRDTPSITLPDDHDVFHGNIWGAGGKLADRSKDAGASAQDSGYKMSVGFVNAVNQSQAGSLPPPVDPAPCESGISVWFTDWSYAGIDMAILGDRQFKSAPMALLPESDIRNGWPRNHDKQRPGLKTPRELDAAGAELLGKRQEGFLEKWSSAQNPGAGWRLVFSATPLMVLQSIPENEFADDVVPGLKRPRPGEYPDTDIPKLDYDSNGWPQSKRDLAVKLITRAHAVHVTGDQHLGSTGQYGVSAFNDSAWWISSPAIANLWPRRWFPKEGGANRREGAPKYTGEFEDGFGNRITLHAAANPYDIDREPARLYDKAVGYAILTLHRENGRISLAVWPYQSAPANPAPDNSPYPGWPITVDPATNRRVD